MIEHSEAVRRIESALREKTGKEWNVKGMPDGWIRVQAPESRRVSYKSNPRHHLRRTTPNEPRRIEYIDETEQNLAMSEADRRLLTEVCGFPHSLVHDEGLHISPDDREWYVRMLESGLEDEGDPTSMPLDYPCQLCHRRPAMVCTLCYSEAAQRSVVERAVVELLNSCRDADEILSQLTLDFRQLRDALRRVSHT